MSQQQCTLLAPSYTTLATSCFVARRQDLPVLGVEVAQQNFLQCITQIPDPEFQACAKGEQLPPKCNCDTSESTTITTTRFRKRN